MSIDQPTKARNINICRNKKNMTEIHIISDINEKSIHNTLAGKEDFAFCGVPMQKICPYRERSNLNYYF